MRLHSSNIVPANMYQCLLFEERSSSIKYKDRFDVMVQKLADAMVQQNEMGVGHRFPFLVPHTLHCLVQPNTYI